MKITKRQLKRIIKEEKQKLVSENAFQDVGGNIPVFHDANLDAALNDYVERYVEHVEEGIGESPGTLALLEVMKGHLIVAIERATQEAMADSGVRY